jgi:uncharacterized protein YbjT (DUF2867 family)
MSSPSGRSEFPQRVDPARRPEGAGPGGSAAFTGPRIFVTGGTGFLGRPLIEALQARQLEVVALVRPGSEGKLPPSCQRVVGDALVADSYADAVGPGDVFVHLVGVAHPTPSKALQFRAVDLASITTAARVARARGVRRFVYVSVAQPAPVMKAYVETRMAGEAILAELGMPTTVIRPWYVIGPKRRWPLLLWPLYLLASWFPATRATALRLGLVTRAQMVTVLNAAVLASAPGMTIIDVPGIRAAHQARTVQISTSRST